MATYNDSAIARLTGSSPSTGRAPTFQPICAAPALFDPQAYIKDMRSAGVTLKPNPGTGQFSIDGRGPNGIPGDALAVGMKWEAAASSDPDWINKVGAALLAEQAPADPVFGLIERHRAAYASLNAALHGPDLDDAPAEDAVEAALRDELAGTPPATPEGLRAYAEYMAAYDKRTGDYETAQAVLATIAEACEGAIGAARLNLVGTGHDAELTALGTELDRLLPLVKEADEERRRLEALRDSNLPPIPAGLVAEREQSLALGTDVDHFTAYAAGEVRYYTAGAIDRLRRFPRFKYVFDRWLEPGNTVDRVMKRVPDDEKQALVPAIIAAFEEWQAACDQHADRIGYTAAAESHRALEEQLAAVFGRITEIVPVSLAGLAVQARAVLRHNDPGLLQYLVADRLTEFAKASVSPAMTGLVMAGDSDRDIITLFDEWVAAVRAADSAEADGIEGPEVEALRRTARRARADVVRSQATTLQGVLLKAMTCNGTTKLASLLSELDDDADPARITLDTICRSVTYDLVEIAGVLPQEWPVGVTRRPARQDTGNLAALYQEATWLRAIVNSSKAADQEFCDPAYDSLAALERQAKEVPILSADDAAVALEWALYEYRVGVEDGDRTGGFIERLVGNVIAYFKRPAIAWPAAAEATQAARAA